MSADALDLLGRLHEPWKLEAACRGMPAVLFFPDKGETAKAAAAKNVCRTCPVKEPCEEAGMGEHWGIWGGATEADRRRIRRQRR